MVLPKCLGNSSNLHNIFSSAEFSVASYEAQGAPRALEIKMKHLAAAQAPENHRKIQQDEKPQLPRFDTQKSPQLSGVRRVLLSTSQSVTCGTFNTS